MFKTGKLIMASGCVAALTLTTACSGDDDGRTTVATTSDSVGSAGTDGTDGTTGSSDSASSTTAGSASASGTTTGATTSASSDTDSGTTAATTGASATTGPGTGGSTTGATTGGSTTGGSTTGGSTTGGSTTGATTGGSTTGDPNDMDNDGIPDDDDPFPMDPDKPGDLAVANVVYAHTSSTLYTMGVEMPYDITTIGSFQYDVSPGSMTDIAIDRYGVLYGVTFNDLYVCNAKTAQCWWLADLPQAFNGLTMIPQGIIEPNSDALVAIAGSGQWYHVQFGGGPVNLVNIGSYGAGYTNDGDAYSIEGIGTYGATNKNGATGTVIVEANPANGNVTKDVTELGVSNVWGLAGWQGSIFAFDSSGQVLRVDPVGGNATVIKNGTPSWWGAGVATVLPQ